MPEVIKKRKALIVPYNKQKQILLQDRTGHKPPPWGYFGGGIEEGETPIQALQREAKEELGLTIDEQELRFIGTFQYYSQSGDFIVSEVFLYPYFGKLDTLTLGEGAGMKFIDVKEAYKLIEVKGDCIILDKVKEVLDINN